MANLSEQIGPSVTETPLTEVVEEYRNSLTPEQRAEYDKAFTDADKRARQRDRNAPPIINCAIIPTEDDIKKNVDVLSLPLDQQRQRKRTCD